MERYEGFDQDEGDRADARRPGWRLVHRPRGQHPLRARTAADRLSGSAALRASGRPFRARRAVREVLQLGQRRMLVGAVWVGCVAADSVRLSLSSLRHQDLRERAAREALLFDDVQLQVLSQLGEWAAPRADRNRNRRQLVFVDEAQAGQRLGEAGPPCTRTVPSSSEPSGRRSLRPGPRRRSRLVPIPPSPEVGEDGLRLLVHRGCDRPLGRGPVRPHDLVAAAAHRVDAGLVKCAAVPLIRVVTEPLEHPFMGPVGAGGKTVEGHHHFQDYFPIAHVGRDLPRRLDSSHADSPDGAGQPAPDAPRNPCSSRSRCTRRNRRSPARRRCRPSRQSLKWDHRRTVLDIPR